MCNSKSSAVSPEFMWIGSVFWEFTTENIFMGKQLESSVKEFMEFLNGQDVFV